MRNVFITGATGFLGAELLCQILTQTDATVHVLVRGKNELECRKRLTDLIFSVNKVAALKETLDRLDICVGDVTQVNLGLSEDKLKELSTIVDTIYHSAAITSLNLPIDIARMVNVNGTRNVLDFALLCSKNGKITKINHISTAYVAGKHKGRFCEGDLKLGQEFNNTYELSKFEAEVLVNEYRNKSLDIDIYRPSIILGRHSDGWTTNFKMFYQPLHFFSLDLFDVIPASRSSRANLINVDIAANIIFSISNNHEKHNSTYHIASPVIPKLEFVVSVASDFFGFREPEFIEPERFDFKKLYTPVQRHMMEPFIPYFNYFTDFDITVTETMKKKCKFEFPDFDRDNFLRLYEFCDFTGAIKRKKNAIVG